VSGDDLLWLIGLIMVTFCGWACASYATNVIYRLPRHEYIFGRKPYCGDCNTLLQPRDLFPIFSWLLTKGKCRYCGAGVPATYFWIEVIGTLLFPLIYMRYGFGDEFILVALTSLSVLSLAMMAYDDDYFSPNTTGVIMICGVIMGTLQQATFTNALTQMFLGFICALALHALHIRKKELEWDLRQIPVYVWLASTAGAWLPMPVWFAAMAAWWLLFHILKASCKSREAHSLVIMAYAVPLLAGIAYAV